MLYELASNREVVTLLMIGEKGYNGFQVVIGPWAIAEVKLRHSGSCTLHGNLHRTGLLQRLARGRKRGEERFPSYSSIVLAERQQQPMLGGETLA